MPQIVYILTNQAMPGLIKIGRTDSGLQSRIKQLNSQTGVPIPFEVHYACEVEDSVEVEKILHSIFDKERYNQRREFFTRNPESVVLTLKSLKSFIKEININEKNTVESSDELITLEKIKSKRRDSFSFNLVDIPVGSELSFTRDENIKATVVDEKKISFNGEITSLSMSAQKLLGSNYPIQGTIYWTFEGETLDERRIRFSES